MKSFDIIGWSYEADLHCPDCAHAYFGDALDDEEAELEDSEGNSPHPVFVVDCQDAEGNDYCGDCGALIWECESCGCPISR